MANTNQSKGEVKRRVIRTAELMRKGWSDSQIISKLVEEYGITESTGRYTIKKALQWLADNQSSKFIDDIRRKQVERSEFLLEQAVAARNWEAANKIVDTLNKTLGLYEHKQKVEIVGDTIRFKFGGLDSSKEGDNGK